MSAARKRPAVEPADNAAVNKQRAPPPPSSPPPAAAESSSSSSNEAMAADDGGSGAHSTQFCECRDMMYVHDSSVFEASAATNGRGARQRATALNVTIAAPKGAHWYCKRCGFTRPLVGPTVVHETRKPGGTGDRSAAALAQIDKYTIKDPTLPREHMRCPNPRCKSHPDRGAAAAAGGATSDLAEVVIRRTHYQRQEYAFVCTVCQHKWMAK